IFFIVVFIIAIGLSIVWARQVKADQPPPSGRRKFLLGSAAVTGGVVGVAVSAVSRVAGWGTVTGASIGGVVPTSDPNPKENWKDSRIHSYRPLGSTGFLVSDISIGSGQITRHPNPVDFLKNALDRGVNYIDTSPDYAGTRSEEAIGKAITGRERAKLFIATKWCTTDGHIRQGASVETYLKALDESLLRLGTDYVDLIHIHSCDSIDRLLDPNVHKAFEIAKQRGKARFIGVSTHTPNLEEVANATIDSKKFDVMMLAYHHGAWPKMAEIVDRAAASGMGVVAMKTLKGAKHKGLLEFRDQADSYTQAAFKWVLSNPAISCLVVSFFETQQVDEYLYASGQSLTKNDVAVLDNYDELIAGTHCFAHCGECLDSCPVSLPINDILRQRMYFEDYGDQKQAIELYAALDKKADACLTCAAPCEAACPEGIPIKDRMLGAHEKLSIG
ncbi:MAG TPA: 4Fe-4S dicluster domain-containing protein, partial [Pseudomonadales bacterium]|nr:4Fe-4S dicluster domain-containing protein [Pseudomonadales bacterium]